MKKMILMVAFCTMSLIAAQQWDQDCLERWLYSSRGGVDDFVNNPEPAYVPLRDRDSIAEFRDFVAIGGWTTNQLVDALICAVTNNMVAERWNVERQRTIAWIAFSKLAEANHSTAQRFVTETCTNDVRCMLLDGLPAVFRRTNLEEDVLDYMRRVCIMTNRYDGIADSVSLELLETLRTMPGEGRQNATNRLSRYLYFVINHVTQGIGFQERRLISILPSYSNSVQRMSAMRYVAATATNTHERIRAIGEARRLSSLPTNEMNNVSWLEE